MADHEGEDNVVGDLHNVVEDTPINSTKDEDLMTLLPKSTQQLFSLSNLRVERNSLLYLSLIFFWYGFFIDFKPSEPFLVPYLIQTKGFTNDQIEQDIFPIWTYAYFVSVVICGLISEVLQYKPVLVLGSLARVATRLILIFGTSMLMMQATQFTFGFACGSEVLFYSYIYYLVPAEQYQKLTGITRSSVLIGHVGANLLGQLLVSRFNSPLIVLLYISLVAISIAGFISLLFPSTSIEIKHCNHTVQGLKSAFVDVVTNPEALQWSIWYIFVMMSNDMVLNYATNLFYVIDPTENDNGWVMALVRLTGAFGAVLPGFIPDRILEPRRKIIVILLTLLAGFTIVIAPFCEIYLVFVAIILYMGMITFGISVASAQIAKNMSTRKFAMVFALITMIYLGFESIFQLVIGSLNLSSPQMFVTFGGGFFVAAGAFMIISFAFRIRRRYARVPFQQEAPEPIN